MARLAAPAAAGPGVGAAVVAVVAVAAVVAGLAGSAGVVQPAAVVWVSGAGLLSDVVVVVAA